MTLCETVKMYPVYVRHASEVFEVAVRVAGIMRRRAERDENDEKLEYLRRFQVRLLNLVELLKDAPGGIAYVDLENRQLVEKVVNWLKDHPDPMPD